MPEEATWAAMEFRTKEVDGAHMLVVHAMQVRPGVPLRGVQYEALGQLGQDEPASG